MLYLQGLTTSLACKMDKFAKILLISKELQSDVFGFAEVRILKGLDDGVRGCEGGAHA